MDENNVLRDLFLLGGISLPCLVGLWKTVARLRANDNQLAHTDCTSAVLQTSDIPFLRPGRPSLTSLFNQNLESRRLLTEGQGPLSEEQVADILQSLSARDQAIVRSDGDLTRVWVPLKGKLQSLESLRAYSGDPAPLIAKTFEINTLNSDGRPLDRRNRILSAEHVAQGLYLDRLDSWPEQISVKGLFGAGKLKLRGNLLDHPSGEAALEDFLFSLLKASRAL